jgi:hypothetical protein
VSDLVLVSWGRPSSGSLSAQVVSTRAHLVDREADWTTLCGVDVPYAARPSTDRRSGRITVMSRVFPDSPDETARLARCQRCARKAPVEG